MKESSFNVTFRGKKYPAHYVKTVSQAELFLKELMLKEVLFGIDTETEPIPEYKNHAYAGLSPHLSVVRLLQVFDGEAAYIFDLRHLMDAGASYEIFKQFLETKRFVAHNATFELSFFRYWFGVRRMNITCTMLIAKLLFHATYPTDEGLSGSLANLAKALLEVDVLKGMQISDWSENELTFEQVEYAALDPLITLKLAERIAPGLEKFGLERIYKLIKAAQHPIVSMQLNGFGLDKNVHEGNIVYWREALYTAKKKVLKATGLSDLTSAKMSDWLAQNLDKEIVEFWPKTPGGKLSTDSNAFVEFSYLPIVEPFAEFQKKKILCSTFGQTLIDSCNPVTGRLHANFKLCGARTGRLSCTKPNLQNLPRSPDKRKHPNEPDIRESFRASSGRTFICADYSQIELRVAAELSRDVAMLEAYAAGIDLHELTASKIMHKPLHDVTKSDRQLAKAFNFGLLFGLGAQKFSHYAKKSYGVDVSNEDAKSSIKIFRQTYAGYREWQLEQADRASQTFECRTPCGKLRRLPEDNTFGNSMNTPVQGGAAEVMLHALVHLDKNLENFDEIKLVNCVHDEIILEAKKGFEGEAQGIVENCMIQGYLDVFPGGITNGLVEAKSGSTWADAK